MTTPVSCITRLELEINRDADPEAPPGITQDEIRAKIPAQADALFEFLAGATRSMNGYYERDVEHALNLMERGLLNSTEMFL